MDDHPHHHHHHPHHQYGMAELRQLMNGSSSMRLTSSSSSSHFPSAPIPSDLFGFNLAATAMPQHHHNQYHELNFVHGLCGDSSAANNNNGNTIAAATTSASAGAATGGGFSGFLDGDGGAFGGGDGGGGTGRWPRQETLTLLEIRSRLDHKFKEANQKGPLWDEVSRIMSEEHGYQRSGKKCREKFENLYKYYKKTKEGKAGRQDGKHYRFFRQLEALYGESSNSVSGNISEAPFVGNSFHFHAATNPSIQTNSNQEALNDVHSHQKLSTDNSLSLSNNSSDFDTSSSDDNDSTRRRRRSWRAKIKDFIDAQMRKLVERQEAWLEKLTKTIEEKERERFVREDEWRKQEAARIDKEHKFWAKEREWIETRDAALIEALQNLTGRQLVTKAASSSREEMIGNENQNENGSDQTMTNNVSVKGDTSWTETEITRLVEIRTSMDSRFQQLISGCSDEFLWEEIVAKLACLGYERSALTCKEKWEWISNYMRRNNKELNKKRKENSSRSCGVYFPGRDDDQSVYHHGSGYNCDIDDQKQVETIRAPQPNNNKSNEGSSPPNSNVGNAMTSSCFPFLMSDGDQNLWDYGLKLSKGENQ